MKVKTQVVYKERLESFLNEINYEKVLNIIPVVEYDATRFMVIYSADEDNQEGTNNEQR